MESTSDLKIIFWLGTLIMLFLAFMLLSMALFYQRRFAKAKRVEAETLLKTSLESEKKERMRIAKDLHDSVQGDLGAIRNYLTTYIMIKKDDFHLDLLNKMNHSLEQTIQNTRLISYKLMPTSLENGELSVAIQNYFEQLNNAYQEKFTLHFNADKAIVSKDSAYELFRVLQEFTNNMLKYGKINECHVHIVDAKNSILIEIIDDGVPFSFKEKYINSKGLGLQNIQSRLNSINAKLEQKTVSNGNHFIILINKQHE